ncbi:MAG: acyl carrier protein [Erysipelotrichales bacterium]|nr:acyl carrier protein [Erysipelotrichales bacterium]
MVFEKIKQLILNEIKIDEAKITMDAKFDEDLGADSLDAVEMVMGVEDQFDIKLSDEEMQSLKTVGDLVRIVEAKI